MNTQWLFSSTEIILLQNVLEAYVAARKTSMPPESQERERAREVYRPGMSCRQLAGVLGINHHAAHRLIGELKASMPTKNGKSNEIETALADLEAQLLSKVQEMVSQNTTFVVQCISAISEGSDSSELLQYE